MSSQRSYLNAVLRDPDYTHNMVAPDPPGPLATDEHASTVNNSPVALDNTNSTAHILDQINPSINPYNLKNDALVKNLANYIDVSHHDSTNSALSTTSSASPYLHYLQPNKHSGQDTYKLIKQEDDNKLQNAMNGVAKAFNSCASIDSSASKSAFKTVLDEAASSAAPSTPSDQLPDIHHWLHKIPKFQGIHIPAQELVMSA